MADNFRIKRGSTLGSCHIVEQILGQGGFGVVAKCRDTESNNTVAVKVVRGKEEFVNSAISEIAALKRLRCLDPDTCNIVQWHGFFFDKENICTVFELLDQSLHEYLQGQDKWGLSVGELRPVLHQVATAVSHLHSIGFVHMDLKPHNIMVVDRHQLPLKVKLIDFGLARPVSALKQGDCMGTMCYCAPEMLLGVPFNEGIDMWALGLIMAELAMGCALYPGDAEYDVLRFVVETQGQPPDDVLDRGVYTDNYFYAQEDGTSRWRFMTPEDVYYEHGYSASDTREVKLNCLDNIEQVMGEDIEHRNDQKLFISLIKSMLVLDASYRITAREVLEHEFFAPSQDQGRDPNPHQAAPSREDYQDPNVRPPIPHRAAMSLPEFNLRHPVPSRVAESWKEPRDFNGPFPTPSANASSRTEHEEANIRPELSSIETMQKVDDDVTVSNIKDSQTEDFTIQTSQMEGEVLRPTPSPTATSQEQGVEVKTQAKTKKKSWLRRIISRVSKALRRRFT